MRFTTPFAIPLLALAALIPLYAALMPLGLAPDLVPYYAGIVIGAIVVWVLSTFLTVGFSVFNEVEAVRRVLRIRRARGNGSARVIAEWFVKKHAWLLFGSLAEAALFGLALTGSAGTAGPSEPTTRGVLYVLLFDVINLCLCLLSVGSTIATRALTYVARRVGHEHGLASEADPAQ